MLAETMKKLEQLLNNEIQYKRTIHELTLKLDNLEGQRNRVNRQHDNSRQA